MNAQRNRNRILLTACFCASLPLVVCYADEPTTEEGFTQIFDGKTLKGWDGSPDLWSVAEGAITGVTTDDAPIKRNEFIIWDGEVADFVLRLEFRIADQGVGNSGIQYRSKHRKDVGKWIVQGYQADIEKSNKYMAILYEEGGRGILALAGEKVVLSKEKKKEVVGSVGKKAELFKDVKAGEWQEYEVMAKGNHLVHKINGKVITDITDNNKEKASSSGVLALQLHRGPAMKVQFRNIRIKDLSEE